MKNYGNVYEYDGYQIVKNGTKDYPYNIYRLNYSNFLGKYVRTPVGYGRTIKSCKADIDSGNLDDTE